MTRATVLIVDDEPDIRELLEITLGRMGLETRSAANLRGAMTLLRAGDIRLCLTDMKLPDGDGLELIQHIQRVQPQIPVAMITAFGSMDTAIDALKAGAFDFITKPLDLGRLRKLVQSCLKLEQAGATPGSGAGVQLLGQAPAIDHLRRQIGRLARSQAPVYISGESGSGKEVVARLIHANGPRAGAPFVPVNCGAIPSELMESEFFGHVKGSFTGAQDDKQGLFEAADGGTLFLDEVADLPLAMQVKLLRAIQEKCVRKVGSNQEVAVDVRILSATHKDLAEEVACERFRSDLFYRINVIEVRVPALRERPGDIGALAEATLARLAQEWQLPRPRLTGTALAALQGYAFPGNVRELENILERAFTLCEGETIDTPDLGLPGAGGHSATTPVPALRPVPAADGQPLDQYLEAVERELIEQALEATRWNRTAAARRLGISFRQLRYRLQKLGLDRPD